MQHTITNGARLVHRLDAGQGELGQVLIVVECKDHYYPQHQTFVLRESRKRHAFTTPERAPMLPARAYLYDGAQLEHTRRYVNADEAVQDLLNVAAAIVANAKEKRERMLHYEVA